MTSRSGSFLLPLLPLVAGCFPALMTPAPAPMPAPPPPTQAQLDAQEQAKIYSQEPAKWPWEVMSKASELDGSTNVIAAKVASDPYFDQFGDQQRPKLIVRCEEKQLRVGLFIYTMYEYAGTDFKTVPLTVRVDDGQPTAMKAELGNDKKSAYLPDAKKLVKALRSASRVVIQFTPHRKDAVTSVFALGEVEKIVDQVAAACPVD